MFLTFKTFYPVGQGGFYSERIWNGQECRTVVYDCGSDTGKVNGKLPIEKCIDESGLENVDYIVISHLDKDHINGLPYLRTYLKKHGLRKDPLLILPKPNPYDILLFLEKIDDEDETLLNYFVDEILCGNRVLYVDDSNESDEIIDLDSVNRAEASHCRNFIFGNNVKTSEIWLLKFYVDASKYTKMDNDDVKQIEGVLTIDDLEKRKEKLKNLYKDKMKFVGRRGNVDSSKMNLSSMSMLSAPFDEMMRDRNCNRIKDFAFASWMNGDICLKSDVEMDKIERHYQKFLSMNFDFQIPHHGSERNLGRLPNVSGKIRPYIWAGTKNKYRHPSYSILKMLKENGLAINWIAEKDEMFIRQEKWV